MNGEQSTGARVPWCGPNLPPLLQQQHTVSLHKARDCENT